GWSGDGWIGRGGYGIEGAFRGGDCVEYGRRGVGLLRMRLKQVPGFAINFEARALASSVGIKTDGSAGGEGARGNDVPEVERDDVGDEEVDVLRGVLALLMLIAVGGLHLEATRA